MSDSGLFENAHVAEPSLISVMNYIVWHPVPHKWKLIDFITLEDISIVVVQGINIETCIWNIRNSLIHSDDRFY